jgi:hypothetical protein
MTAELAEALDALTPAQRRVLAALAGEQDRGWLSDLLAGLAYEAAAMDRADEIHQMREMTLFHDLEADHLADVERRSQGATWSTEIEDRSQGRDWWPESD